MKKISCALLITCFFVSLNTEAQQHVINTFSVSGAARWDYISVGPVHDWVYVSHGTEVRVINKLTGDSVTVIPNTIGVHGIAFDAAHNKGFTSNGRINSVTVFDMNTNKVLDQIAAGKDPDAIFYEPFSKKIITCNGDGENISIIDPVTDKVVDSVDVGGDPETAVSDGAGKIFINLEDKSEIVAIDAKTFTVVDHWSIAPGNGPTGLSIDATAKRLFAGCRNVLMVINAENGAVIDSIPIGKGCDGTAFDNATKMIYASCGDGTITAVHEDNANKFTVAERIITKRGARTLALDKDTHHIYLPTAEYEPMQPGQTGRPKTKDGTFQILVVGK
jgi:DNA-binding beta-propeller fold protein YncE